LWGCGEAIAPVCLDDPDEDALCGLDDPCPLDPLNDGDGDGVCGQLDQCAQGPDDLDDDEDGLADACDACPTDALNDADADAICDSVDACPGDVAPACTRRVTLGLTVDRYFEESTWVLRAGDGAVIDQGAFDAPGAGLFRAYDVATDVGPLCLELTDTYGDGGVRGALWDEVFGVERFAFETVDWDTSASFCMPFEGGAPADVENPYSDRDFTEGLDTCWVELSLQTFTWGSEIGWSLGDRRRTIVASRSNGTYQNNTLYTEYVELTEGEWIYVMQDSARDGWHGGTIEIRAAPGADPLGTGSLPGGAEGYVPFTLVCPDAGGFPPP
jgi:hypothetical protein